MPQPMQAAEGTAAPPPGALGAPPGGPVPPPPSMPPAAAPPPQPQPPSYPKSGPGWVCLYPGCDGAPEFDAPARLRGPGDSYLAHILAATGCTAKVAGKGSGAPPPPAGELEPPLHLRLEHADAAKLEEGRRCVICCGCGAAQPMCGGNAPWWLFDWSALISLAPVPVQAPCSPLPLHQWLLLSSDSCCSLSQEALARPAAPSQAGRQPHRHNP